MTGAAMSTTGGRGRARGVWLFLRSCISSPANLLLSVVLLLLAVVAVSWLVRWSALDAVWNGTSGKDCAGQDGACWIYLRARAEPLLFGAYPAPERWRVGVSVALIGAAVLAGLVKFGLHTRRSHQRSA